MKNLSLGLSIKDVRSQEGLSGADIFGQRGGGIQMRTSALCCAKLRTFQCQCCVRTDKEELSQFETFLDKGVIFRDFVRTSFVDDGL